jgi:hypothetical protein
VFLGGNACKIKTKRVFNDLQNLNLIVKVQIKLAENVFVLDKAHTKAFFA